MTPFLKGLASKLAAAIYLLITLEVIIMITPFAVYFYSLYAPVLDSLFTSPETFWLTEFFLPHIAVTADPLLNMLALAAPVFLLSGLGIFLLCASQVYYAKLAKKGVVVRGLYSRVRHPQYLGLALAGLGLLLYWPRFIVLLSYVTMLFLYYFLARDEERRMLKTFPETYRVYMTQTGMFIPASHGNRIVAHFPRVTKHKILAAFLAYVVVASALIGVGFAFRDYSISHLSTTYYKGNLVLALLPMNNQEIAQILGPVFSDERVASVLDSSQHRGMIHLIYVFPDDFVMQDLIIDARVLESHSAHHGQSSQGYGSVIRHVTDMLILRSLDQLQHSKPGPVRVVITQAMGPESNVEPTVAMKEVAKTVPFLMAEYDLASGEIVGVMETPPRHSWGTIPVPLF